MTPKQSRMSSRFSKLREEIDLELHRIFKSRGDIPSKLLASMKYSLFAGGKRLRPMLAVASAQAVGGDSAKALPTAVAFELIHTYTLIHDDLPAMDDDDLRRGIATNHKKFGEATAILAGDALLTLAFEIIAEPLSNGSTILPSIQVKVLQKVAQAVGAEGTVGGQEVDMECEECDGDIKKLEYIHTRKTGAMITAAVEAGGIIGGGDEQALKSLTKYGNSVGHAFQIIDDILDVTGETSKMGKSVGSDEGNGKMTYPLLIGLEESKKLADKMIDEALTALPDLNGDTSTLKGIAEFIGKRTH